MKDDRTKTYEFNEKCFFANGTLLSKHFLVWVGGNTIVWELMIALHYRWTIARVEAFRGSLEPIS